MKIWEVRNLSFWTLSLHPLYILRKETSVLRTNEVYSENTYSASLQKNSNRETVKEFPAVERKGRWRWENLLHDYQTWQNMKLWRKGGGNTCDAVLFWTNEISGSLSRIYTLLPTTISKTEEGPRYTKRKLQCGYFLCQKNTQQSVN